MNQNLMVFFQEIIKLKKIKDGAYIINIDEYANLDTHRIALFCKKNEIVYFNSFGVEYISEDIQEFIKEFPGNINIKTNTFRVQEDNSIMCGYFYIVFIDFIVAGKKLTDYTHFFSPHDLKKKQ